MWRGAEKEGVGPRDHVGSHRSGKALAGDHMDNMETES